MIINRLKQLERRTWGSPRTRHAITFAALGIVALTVLPMCGTASVVGRQQAPAQRQVASEYEVRTPPPGSPAGLPPTFVTGPVSLDSAMKIMGGAPFADSMIGLSPMRLFRDSVRTQGLFREPQSSPAGGWNPSGSDGAGHSLRKQLNGPPDTTLRSFWTVERRPTLVRGPSPVYPDSARRAGLEGDVFVEVVVGGDGMVESAAILRGPQVFQEAALAAAMQMVFTPPLHARRPARVKVAQRVSFRLNDPTGAQGTAAEFWSVETKPTILSQPSPVYPDSAKRAGIEGDVFVQLVVGVDGKVESAEVLHGLPVFHEAARNAAMGMTFSPAMVSGVPKRVIYGQKFSFRLNPSQ